MSCRVITFVLGGQYTTEYVVTVSRFPLTTTFSYYHPVTGAKLHSFCLYNDKFDWHDHRHIAYQLIKFLNNL